MSEAEVDRAIEELSLGAAEARKCSADEAFGLLSRVTKAFCVPGSPSLSWENLQAITEYHDFPDRSGYVEIARRIPQSESTVWLIPEDAVAAYEVTPAKVGEVVGECFFFVYFVVGKHLDWLLVENDHNQVMVAAPVAG